jgi:hypothetical protein
MTGSSAPDSKPQATKASAFSQLTDAATSLIRALLLVVVIGFVFWHWSYFGDWLETLTHGEITGLAKFDRNVATKSAKELADDPKTAASGNFNTAVDAIGQAALVAPALQGARILWLDQDPGHNPLERRLLEQLGIHIQLAWSLDDAIRYAQISDQSVDLVISSVAGPSSGTVLQKCPAHYFDFPSDTLRQKYSGDLVKFNADTQLHPPFGLAFAERLSQENPKQFGFSQRSRIIFYSSASGGILADQCARISTNHWDILVQSVVSALAELRADKLQGYTITPKTAKTASQSGAAE